MDLFTPQVPVKDFHPNFRRLIDKHSAANRAVVEQWANGFLDRDGKFVREFQTTFNSGFWELYLFACLKVLDFQVDFTFSAPDFVITNFHNEFCIEAVIASNAIGEEAEWERDPKKAPNLEAVLDTAVIRLSNAIHAKYQKYLTSYGSLPPVKDRPFVLAVGPFEQPYFWAQNDHAIRQVLYAYDRIAPDGKHTYRQSINKRSGAPIQLGLFTSPKMSEISAVIFSNTATMSKVIALNDDKEPLIWFTTLKFNAHGREPILKNYQKKDYQESALDGLYVFHNHFAKLPLPRNYFDHSDITQAILIPGEAVPRYYAHHGNLIQRGSFTARAKESMEGV